MTKVEQTMKGLECCSTNEFCPGQECPYNQSFDCHQDMASDALALIKRLANNVGESERWSAFLYDQNDELESKLNQAVEDIRMLGRTGEFICPVCAHYNHGEGTKGECVKCLTGDGFRWRGEKMDGGAE